MSWRAIDPNDLCPCKSGFRFKVCHGYMPPGVVVPPQLGRSYQVHHRNEVPIEVIKKAAEIFAEKEQKEQERIAAYGHGRPDITLDLKGQKLVAIGGKLMYRPAEKCRYLTDILMEYIPTLFGKEWFDAEIAKPAAERHPVMQWRFRGMNYMRAQPRTPNGDFAAIPTGPLLAYLTFAYDLYVVENNSPVLDQRFIERLKHMDQFQGARHELFAAATCIRGGFRIEPENQGDRSRRHAEFTATHLTTKLQLSVEAKSKHRPGVLGQAGTREPEDNLNLPFGRLLRDAVAKNPPHPLVVFLDMNMPAKRANEFLAPTPGAPPHPFIIKTVNQIRKEHDGKDPITMLVMTNHPSHYTDDRDIPPNANLMTQVSQIPVKMFPLQVLWDLHRAANLYGKIPQEFSKN